MEQKKFMDIQRLKEGYADGFVPGDLIVIQENTTDPMQQLDMMQRLAKW